jgi:hypothetical protein
MVALKEPPKLSEEELPEARVPTTLVRNQVTILGEDGLEHEGLFIVGPYHVIRGLVRAPQAWLVEGIGPTGERALIQLVHCRAVGSRAEELERQAFERQVADDTVALFDEPGFIVHAHGHVQRNDGSHVLFWALPWHDGALGLASPGSTIRNADHLLEIAIVLASRVQRRHDKERLDALLSEELVAVTDGSTELLGVPLFIPPSWLAPEMPAAKMAPEEKGHPTRLGDIWRLGHALTALAATLEAIPSAFSNLLKWMTHDDPKKRPPRAIEVEVECRNIRERLAKSPLTSPVRPASASPLSFDEVSQLVVASMGPKDTAPTALASPADREIAMLQGEEEVTLAGSVNVRALDHPPSPTGVPPWAFFFSLREYERFVELIGSELTARRLDHRIGTGVVQLIADDGAELEYIPLSEMARDCFRAEPDQWRQIIAMEVERRIGALADTLDSDRKRRAQAHLEEPTQKVDERHLRLVTEAPERRVDDSPTDPPLPKSESDDVVEIKVGGAVDLAAIVEAPIPPSSETIAERPAVHGPHPTSPFAGTLPSHNPEDARVPEALRRIVDDLPFQPTLPAPRDPGHVPEELRAAAKKNLETPTWPDVYPPPEPITPNHDVRAIGFPQPIPKGFTVPARPVDFVRPLDPPHPQPLRPAPVPTPAPLIEGAGTLDPSMAAAAKGSPGRNLLVAALLVVSFAAIVAAIVFAERPVEKRTTFTEITLDGEIIVRADPPSAIIVGERDGRVLGQAPLRFLVPRGAETGVIVTAPGRMPKRVVLTGAGEVTATLDEIAKHAAECEVPFTGVSPGQLSGVTGNMEIEMGRLRFEGSSVVRTKPGSRESGAWIVRCPPSGLLETITLETKPIEAAELRITKPTGATAYVEGKSIGPIPAGATVPKAFTKVAIDEGQGSKGPLWIPVSTDVELRLPIVPENLAR